MEMLVVTIPQNTRYKDIKNEVDECNNNIDIILNHKLGKNKPKRQPTRICLIYRGETRFIGNLVEYSNKSFKCSTTDVRWSQAWYAVFDNVIEVDQSKRIKLKGFQGFRYMNLDI